MALLLGIDLGTSSVKTLVIDDRGVVRASSSATYPLSRPRPQWSEQDPGDWWSASRSAIRDALTAAGRPAGEVAAVGLSGQMHGSVFLPREALVSGGRECDSLRPAILWNDQRTAAQCAAIERAAGGRLALVELVGNAALPGFTLPKILWVREHEPEVLQRTAMILLPKDYLRLRLTGDAATDAGDASGLLLLDVRSRAYNPRALSLFGIDPALLPPVVESAAITGRVTPWAAEQTGLAEGTPVVAGSGDNQAGAVGAGVVAPGMVLATLGTSGVIYSHADEPRLDVGVAGAEAGRVHTMCAADGDSSRPGRWCVTGCMLSAAGSLQWCRDALWPGEGVESLLREAEDVPAGSGGLVFLPYLTGERCPHPDPSARGAWVGLTSRHTRGHLVRAVLEGVAIGLAQVLDLQRSIGVRAAALRVGGGGGRSVLWRRILADATGLPVSTTNTQEGPAFGAALLAGAGAGAWAGVRSACAAVVADAERVEPDPAGAAALAPSRRVYDDLYGALKGVFADLTDADR